MSTRNLKHLFNPEAIAVIGPDSRDDKTTAQLVRNLLDAKPRGPVLPVTPKQKVLHGVLAYPDVASLPFAPALAAITAPLEKAPALIAQLGERGTRAALLLSQPLEQLPNPEKARELVQAALDAAKPYTLRMIGPDSFGFAAPHHGLNATLSHTPIRAGHISIVSQSSAVLRSLLEWADEREIGFSHAISVGARIDVDFSDLLDYLAQDMHTRAILLYVESIQKPRKFMTAARIAARIKPVVVLKPRDHHNTPEEDAIYDAAFRRAGILRVTTIDQLFTAVETMATIKPVYNDRLAIIGNSRSIGLLASESLLALGGRLAGFSEAASTDLTKLLPKTLPLQNPLDLGDKADAKLYGEVLDRLLHDNGNDAVLVAHAPVDHDTDLAIAEAVIERAKKSSRMVLTCWVGGATADAARRHLHEQRLASYANPSDAARAFTRIAQFTRNLDLLMATPPSLPEAFSVDSEKARQIFRQALAEGRKQLSPTEALTVLEAYGIPTLPTHIAKTPQEAQQIAQQLGGGLVALKIMSPDIRRRTDVGGVKLAVESELVEQTAKVMQERVQQLVPEARLEGFVVQPQLARNGRYELMIGVYPSQGFGPVIRFGHGGTETEVIDDRAYALPPLNMKLAQELVSRTRLSRLLRGSPGRSIDLDELCLTLLKVSQMVVDIGELAELEINPLRAGDDGVIALDTWISIQPWGQAPASERLAIRPYPKELEQNFNLPDGRHLLIRPIGPEDEPALQEMVRRTPQDDLRLRFFQPIRELSHAMAARLTQLDYDREMALAVCDPGIAGKADIWAVVRMTMDPSLEKAEYAILVNRHMAGMGLGPMLMRRIIDYARSRGVKELYGEVLRENQPMLKLNQALGFKIVTDPDDPSLLRVSLAL